LPASSSENVEMLFAALAPDGTERPRFPPPESRNDSSPQVARVSSYSPITGSSRSAEQRTSPF
jgi:hypothetical protein